MWLSSPRSLLYKEQCVFVSSINSLCICLLHRELMCLSFPQRAYVLVLSTESFVFVSSTKSLYACALHKELLCLSLPQSANMLVSCPQRAYVFVSSTKSLCDCHLNKERMFLSPTQQAYGTFIFTMCMFLLHNELMCLSPLQKPDVLVSSSFRAYVLASSAKS